MHEPGVSTHVVAARCPCFHVHCSTLADHVLPVAALRSPCSAMAYRRKCMSDDPWELTHKACRLLNGVIPFNPYSTLPPSEDWGSYSSEDERKDTGDDAWL